MHDTTGSLRLPTRCPVCKGAVLERTPGSGHGTFLWFHCLFCNHWWRFFRDQDPYANADGELTGEMFIVTKDGRANKLDAVTVSAIPEDPLKKHLLSKKLQCDLEIQRLQRDIDGVSAALAIAQAEEDRLWKLLQLDTDNSEKAARWSVAYKKSKTFVKHIEDLQAERQQLTSGEYLFEALPSGISTAKTDADGTFSLVIPCRGRYGIVARGPRELFRDTEPYWFVWVSLDGETSKHLVLNNDNILSAESRDSALHG